MELSDKQKILAFALKARGLHKASAVTIMMLLDTENEIDDMIRYIKEQPNAQDEELIDIAKQLDNKSRKKGLK